MFYAINSVILCLLASGVAIADYNITLRTTKTPGIIKSNGKHGHKGNTTIVKSEFVQNVYGTVNSRSIFKRQECPPGFPELCPNGLCCEAATVCCEDNCCPDNFPICQPNDTCCPVDTVVCGTIDPTHCHSPGTSCCGGGIACPISEQCCGENCCLTANSAKCCPGGKSGSVCCGEYEVCCDGWCCYEGSTCDSEFGYCIVPQLVFGYVAGGISAQLVENACLGIRKQLALGAPYTTAQSQIVTYAGPGNDNRQFNDCRSSRRCCQGRTVPAGQPGTGDPMSCEEYPFNSVLEGGANAQTSCVDDFANKGAGDLIGAIENSKHAGFKFQVAIEGIDCNTVIETDLAPCNP